MATARPFGGTRRLIAVGALAAAVVTSACSSPEKSDRQARARSTVAASNGVTTAPAAASGNDETSPGPRPRTSAVPSPSASSNAARPAPARRGDDEFTDGLPEGARLLLADQPNPNLSWRLYLWDRKDGPGLSFRSAGGGHDYWPGESPISASVGTTSDRGSYAWVGHAPAETARVVATSPDGRQLSTDRFGSDAGYPSRLFWVLIVPSDMRVETLEAFDANGRSLGKYSPPHQLQDFGF